MKVKIVEKVVTIATIKDYPSPGAPPISGAEYVAGILASALPRSIADNPANFGREKADSKMIVVAAFGHSRGRTDVVPTHPSVSSPENAIMID